MTASTLAQMSISKDEVNLYDRQIRLWGMDGQRRLQEAKFLVIGFGAAAVEVVKNIVLAGVGSVTVVDGRAVEESDLATNFFVRAENIGEPRAVASLPRIQRLNPRVAVTADGRRAEELSDEEVAEYSVVIVSDEAYSELVRLNNVTRAAEHAFYATGLMGWAGYIFADLIEHVYAAEKPISNVQTKPGQVSLTREILSVDKKDDKEVLTVKERYGSLETAVANATSVPFADTLRPRARGRVSPYLPALLASWDTVTLSTADIEAKARQLGLPATLVTPEFVREFLRGQTVELSAVAAVIGGFLAQDAINYLTRREHPIQNFIIYDSRHGQGPMYSL